MADVGGQEIQRLRKRLKLSQRAFARTFGISLSALRHWEQGVREPRGPARSLLTIIDKEPEAAMRALKGEKRRR